MHLRDGSLGQKALFAALICVALAGLALAVADKIERIGTPNVGWLLDEVYVSPTRADASEAGLRGGGRMLSINGVAVPEDSKGNGVGPGTELAIGATNHIVLRALNGEQRELTLEVRPWVAHDFLFTQGASDVIGLLFLIIGVASFVLRPYQPESWAQLALCCLGSGALLSMFLPSDAAHPWTYFYFLVIVAFIPSAILHAALSFPVPHPLVLRRPRLLWLVYAFGVMLALLYLRTFFAAAGHTPSVRPFGAAAMLGATLLFIGRCAHLAWHGPDPLTAQRARILLLGAVLGLAPFELVQFLREAFSAIEIDSRFVIWPMALFGVAMARVTVRQELMNARIAVRRAVLYTGAVAVLTVLALLLIAVRPYAVVVLLFPLLYLWPRFDARLIQRLYPQRARFPELLRGLGAEMAEAPTLDAVLDVLASAPGRLCDARCSVAFLFAGVAGPEESVRSVGALAPADRPLGEELLVQLMRTTRREILRGHLAVQPQYSNIRAECADGFERLGAELLVPLVHESRAVGGLAIGARASGDPYEAAEIDALSTVAQQAVQAIMRVEAMERLRARELEFADLKRFFPPQVIDHVMARGGAAELRTQRKVVTVMFADLRGFTAFSDSVEPEEVMATLAEYHAVMGERIAEYGGTLEHFAGDGFMVFFNDPVEQPDHPARAMQMALAMRDDVERLRQTWLRRGYQIHVGMGVHSGFATCGFVGYEGRRDYSVIGNVTNLAARLCDAAAPGEILVSARVLADVGEGFAVEPAGELSLKGFHQAYEAYRLLGIAERAVASQR